MARFKTNVLLKNNADSVPKVTKRAMNISNNEFCQELQRVLFYGSQVQIFDLFSCPGSFSQKVQTGFDAGILLKTFDRDAPAHFFPTNIFNQVVQDHFERDSVQGILRLFVHHLFDLLQRIFLLYQQFRDNNPMREGESTLLLALFMPWRMAV